MEVPQVAGAQDQSIGAAAKDDEEAEGSDEDAGGIDSGEESDGDEEGGDEDEEEAEDDDGEEGEGDEADRGECRKLTAPTARHTPSPFPFDTIKS